ncbi:hypothetical protein DF186_24110, partial [Enterococcus hirae]
DHDDLDRGTLHRDDSQRAAKVHDPPLELLDSGRSRASCLEYDRRQLRRHTVAVRSPEDELRAGLDLVGEFELRGEKVD